MAMPCRARIWAWRYSGQWSAYFAMTTWATSRSVGRPPSISRGGAGACTTVPSQVRQAYFGRRDDHLVLRRDDVEPLRAIFTHHMHRPAATWAGGVLRLDDDLDPRQMLGKRPAAGASPLGAAALQRRVSLLLFGLGLGDRLFEIFQRQV